MKRSRHIKTYIFLLKEIKTMLENICSNFGSVGYCEYLNDSCKIFKHYKKMDSDKIYNILQENNISIALSTLLSYLLVKIFKKVKIKQLIRIKKITVNILLFDRQISRLLGSGSWKYLCVKHIKNTYTRDNLAIT